jgi:hypothetical protein
MVVLGLHHQLIKKEKEAVKQNSPQLYQENGTLN